MLKLYTAVTPGSAASLPMKASSLSSHNWVLMGVKREKKEKKETKYINKDVFWNPKGEGKGSVYHFPEMITP